MDFFGFLRAGEFTVNCKRLIRTITSPHRTPWWTPLALRYMWKVQKQSHFGRVAIFSLVREGQLSLSLSNCSYHTVSQAQWSIDRPNIYELIVWQSTNTSSFIHDNPIILQAAWGCKGQFSGNNFWIGAVTTAAGQGVQDHLMKTLGRWSSDAYQRYIRTPVHTILSVSEKFV